MGAGLSLAQTGCVEGRFPVKVIYSAVFTWNIVMKRDVKLRLLRCKVQLIYIKACGEIGVLNNLEHLVCNIHLSNVHAQVCAQESMLCSACDSSSNRRTRILRLRIGSCVSLQRELQL